MKGVRKILRSFMRNHNKYLTLAIFIILFCSLSLIPINLYTGKKGKNIKYTKNDGVTSNADTQTATVVVKLLNTPIIRHSSLLNIT